MNTKFIFSTLLLLNFNFSFSQNKKLTQEQFIADSLNIIKPKIVRPQFRLDNRTIFLKNQQLNIAGFDIGVLLKDKLRITLGYYYLPKTEIKSYNKLISGQQFNANYSTNYGALNMEFIYKNTRFFSLGMPLEFGAGQNTLSYKSTSNQSEIDKKKTLIFLSYFGLSGTFKPIRWIGLKASMGYRKTIYNKQKEISFNGFYTSVGLAIDFREIIRDTRMYRLKKRYKKHFNTIGTAVDLITD